MNSRENRTEPLCVINIKDFCKEMDLEIVHCEFETFELYDGGINRPGLQLHGYYEYFDASRIQIIGKVEMSYLMSLDERLREKRINDFFSYNFPCFIVCWDLPQVQLFEEAAEKQNRILLKSKEKTTSLTYRLVDYVDTLTAPRTGIHGVLVEVHGVGVVITGASGIGKSETALELIKRGNSFIADDVVEITCHHSHTLMGEAPEMLRYYMEVRGIGIIDVRMLYGAKSVKRSVEIDMVIRLENWNDRSPYDRLGLDEETTDILGVEVPLVTIPVSGGRNLAAIIETAAINNRMKAAGFRSAQIFCDNIARHNEEVAEERRRKQGDKSETEAPDALLEEKKEDENA
ncbi:MAG: HPr(Ser) kinase/phosphatase [Eubacterium aggregans]|uniref:HPr kinase/phosphorylase n=1 Tax=Eubacterium aggregans TaxID=81409 RepID=A0A1H4B4K6_9FIRM|nr:HPr(Ser) kinase/phosphatase [Eubacterium aggregans]MDD4690667.1 HPr(Ser) kinase/phosphatase [Eubacterium aggregans]MEA5073441.1 HPr(Ser) kinase/phosphatase [Eubacterium aggregans]SEA42954.1 Hpr(Ser) kinase/phosphatase [Eubacterium aggregans]